MVENSKAILTNKLLASKIVINIVLIFTIYYSQKWGISISKQLVVDNSVSWFIPTGIKYCVFLFLPYRFWPAAFIALIASPNVLPSFDLRNWFFGYIYPLKTIFIFAIAAYAYRRKHINFKVNDISALLYWLACFFIAGVINASLISVEAFKFSDVATYQLLEFIGAITIGDFIGVIIVLPIFLSLSIVMTQRHWYLESNLLKGIFFTLVIISGINLIIVKTKPELLYFSQLIALVVLIFVIYKKGYILGLSTLFSVNTVIVVNSYFGIRADTTAPDQLFIVALSLVGLFVGAAFEEQRKANKSLTKANKGLLATTAKLADSNKILLEANQINQHLARRNIEIQELEKQRISRELHDEFGQQLTALKTNAQILTNVKEAESSEKYLAKINSISDDLYCSLKNMVSILRPTLLDQFGLRVSLEDGDIKEAVVNAGIHYTCNIDIDEKLIADEVAIAIYRISQEATNNTIKHAQAKNISIVLNQLNDLISLSIEDDGIGYDLNAIEHKSGHGLSIIKERVISLGGVLKINSEKINGTKINIKFEDSLNF
jgi:glucose-6-phosphate-specific signal transduction histidine kinase